MMARRTEFKGRNVEISSDIDIDSLLSELPIEMRTKALKKAVRAAGRVVAKDYRKRLPRGKTGNLKSSVAVKVKGYNNESLWMSIVGARRPTGSHAHLIEDGWDVKSRGPGRKGQPPLSGTARVEGKHDLLAASTSTVRLQNKIIIDTITAAIVSEGG
jgi:hypothetical protein